MSLSTTPGFLESQKKPKKTTEDFTVSIAPDQSWLKTQKLVATRLTTRNAPSSNWQADISAEEDCPRFGLFRPSAALERMEILYSRWTAEIEGGRGTLEILRSARPRPDFLT